MSDYIVITDYAAKDALLTGNPAKLVKGTEIKADLDAVAVAVATKYDSTDLGVTVQAYDADTTKNDVANTFTAQQSFSNNIAFTGTGNRITGDFSNVTRALSVLFQTSTGGANRTQVGAIPPAGATQAQFEVLNDPDATDCQLGQFLLSASDLRITSTIQGTAIYLPMTFYTGGAERMRIDSSGNVLVTGATGLGYGTGAGGTVTQGTSRTTGVTINKPTGAITLFSKAATAALVDSFIVTNSLVAATDVIQLSFQSCTVDATDIYIPVVSQVSAGSFRVSIYTPAATADEAPVLNFAIIKGSAT